MKIFNKTNPQRQNLKQWDFEGIGKKNKGQKYREYGASENDAIVGICTGYRISPKDIQLVR